MDKNEQTYKGSNLVDGKRLNISLKYTLSLISVTPRTDTLMHIHIHQYMSVGISVFVYIYVYIYIWYLMPLCLTHSIKRNGSMVSGEIQGKE